MPSKKKKGKGSKLTRMSEEEKLRYLQHRAEIELETKRRKQQLIAAFTKNKLKREETFARLNLAKINEQWRFRLRQFKCKELYDDLEYLWKYFDVALKTKNAVIDQLYEKLNKADIDHRKLQASHIKMMDKFINNHRLRLDKLHLHYMKTIGEIKMNELSEMNRVKCALYENCKEIQVIAYAQNNFIEEKLMNTKIRNAINLNTVEYSKMEDKTLIEKEIGSKIDNLRSILNNIIIDYQEKTADKRKHYEILAEQDEAHQNEASHFPVLQSQLIHTIESLQCHENIQRLTGNKTILELTNQNEMSNKQIYTLRQNSNRNHTVNQIQLKRQTIVSASVLEYLKKLKQKSATLMLLIKLCSNYRGLLLNSNNCNIDRVEKCANKNICCMIKPYDKLEKFWLQYNYVKSENIFIKANYNQLMNENNQLQDEVRSYLITVARISGVKSENCNFTHTKS